jgi:hypothetical protein
MTIDSELSGADFDGTKAIDDTAEDIETASEEQCH